MSASIIPDLDPLRLSRPQRVAAARWSRVHLTADASNDRRAEATALLIQLYELADDDPLRAALRDRLVAIHRPLVLYLARRFAGRGEPLDDLVQVGTIGLLNAIDRFDPRPGLAFSTYATPTIVGVIKHHLRDTGWLLHVPRRATELQPAIATARSTLSQHLGREPTVPEVAAWVGVSESWIVDALNAARSHTAVPLEPLAAERSPEHNQRALRFIEAGFEQVERRVLLHPLLDALPDAEREVLILRFIGSRTQAEIARLTGRSQMQVSRLLARALVHLHEGLTSGPTARTPSGPVRRRSPRPGRQPPLSR